MTGKKQENDRTAYYDSETGRYFAEIMYASREGRERTVRNEEANEAMEKAVTKHR